TADARRTIATLRAIASLPEEGRRALAAFGPLTEEAGALRGRARYAEAEKILREVQGRTSRWLGEAHPDTARSYNNLALALWDQGQHAEAEAMHRQALAI